MTPYFLFDFIIKKVDNINDILKYLLLEIISKKLNKNDVFFNYFNKL